ncbi:wax ester/triacylglycerol synthase family O-acyltransferase [Antrihabitans cavernicola]|uniref:Diacylglycerol O-acyltransferase n=1 Tax=Antrihabitans cavernicola TaxID=2495913 RepID=A0A5A7S5U9_9NOCA|nr:wax ester/triacylglycerol synthase family O-acyltransferase [Spelaeibacter cavernicola]KAA0021256.1 wax ester/triacylglycerol synthase family O-acyltransferase [Spelaeibacter cavernicola]
MAVKVVSPLDSAFMLVERDEMPWHASLLMVFTLPDDAGADFVSDLREQMRGSQTPAVPFNLAPVHARLTKLPMMRTVSSIDVDHHVRLHRLPRNGGERELNELVGQLHGERLDMSRPLWELHLIEGLPGNRFGAFIKIHHSVVDGITGMRRLLRWLSPDPEARDCAPLFTVGPGAYVPREETGSQVTRVAKTVGTHTRAAGQLSRTVYQLVRGSIDGEPLAVPYQSPKSVWHGRISNQRSIASKQFDLERLKAAAADHGVGLGDVVLYMCGSALRSYLANHGGVPAKPLTGGVPMSIRDDNDERPGSAFGFVTVDLGTNVADPVERLAAVTRSNTASKTQLGSLSDEALGLQTVVANGPMIAALALGTKALTPAAFGLVISNIPGPKKPLYLNGARLESLIPVSVPMHNSPINMTAIGHDGRITFGMVAASEKVPELGQVADGLVDALVDLEKTGNRRKLA